MNLSQSSSEFEKENLILHTKSVIIGAGISGISTAINLLENNYEEFLIFEANDRIGGRCHTVDYGEDILEYGAQFIHGQVENPIYEIAIRDQLIDDVYKDILYESDEDLSKHNGLKIDFESKDKIQYFLTQNGVKLSDELVEVAYNGLNKAIRQAEGYFKQTDNKLVQDRPLGDFIYEKFRNFIQEEFAGKIDENQDKILDGLFAWRCKWENIENSCASVFDLSLNYFSNFIELKGSQTMELKRGYKSLLDCVISKHKEKIYEKLNLNHCLKHIYLCQKLDDEKNEENCEHCRFTKDKNKIVVILNLNCQTQLAVICDNIVCTMSLGFLKENLTNIIQPNSLIPEDKLAAISRLGYGTVNKIILVYDKPFWEEELEGINLIRLHENKKDLFDTLKHENFDFKSKWHEDICSFEPAINHKNILIGWIGGNYYHECLSDQEISKQCTLTLRKFLARDDIPEPVDVIRSKWNSEPYFRGSYSFISINSKSDDNNLIAEPISFNNRAFIQFAGEATHAKHFSTVHGAYLTGLRESERILKFNS